MSTVGVLVAARDLPAGTTIEPGDERTAKWLGGSKPRGALADAVGQVLGGPMRAGEAFTSARVLGRGLLGGQPARTVALPVRLSDEQTSLLVAAGDQVDVLVSPNDAGSVTADLEDGTNDGIPDGAHGGDDDVATGSSPALTADPAPSDQATPTLEPIPPTEGAFSYGAHTESHSAQATRVVSGATVLAVETPSGSGGGQGGSGGGAGGLGGLTNAEGGGSSGMDDRGGLLVLAVTSGEAAELASAQATGYLAIAILPRPGS